MCGMFFVFGHKRRAWYAADARVWCAQESDDEEQPRTKRQKKATRRREEAVRMRGWAQASLPPCC